MALRFRVVKRSGEYVRKDFGRARRWTRGQRGDRVCGHASEKEIQPTGHLGAMWKTTMLASLATQDIVAHGFRIRKMVSFLANVISRF